MGLALLHRGGFSCRKKEKRICDFSTAVRLSPELSVVGHGENINGRVDQNGQNVFAFAQCGNLRVFLPLGSYVKSIMAILKA